MGVTAELLVRDNFPDLTIFVGTGTPESNVTAGIGAIFLRTDGGANTVLYVKEANSDATGWAAK